jgi:chorismate mutase/prephenate dehydratase
VTNTPTNEALELSALRAQIDTIDEQIGELISQRATCAQAVAKVKSRHSDGAEIDFYRPEREAQVLRNAMERNKGPLSNEEFARLFREIMSACLALENPLKVAFLGPEGTFTHEAALKHFGASAKVLPMTAIDEVFREVESGACHFGVVPVENSTEGVVTHTLDSFMTSNIKICGEVVLRIHHNLMASDVTKVESISRIYAHAQALAQCRKWLDARYPNVEKIATSSNAEAAKRMRSEWNAAAIAGETAALLYGLKIIAEKIEDMPDNSTRFLIVGRQSVGASGQDKTSIVVAVHNKPGALHDILEPFQRFGVDLTRVESRPSRTGTWNYVFFIDFEGHLDKAPVKSAIAEVSKRAADVKILGSYPKGVL